MLVTSNIRVDPNAIKTAFVEQMARNAEFAADLPDLQLPLHRSALGSAVLLSVSAPNAPPRGYARSTQIALPLSGIFGWHVGRQRELVDSNTALFITDGQEYAESHPVRGLGHASAIVLPSIAALDEVRSQRPIGSQDPFHKVVVSASPRAQLIAHQLLRLSPDQMALAGDELVAQFLLALHPTDSAAATRLARPIAARAKEYLHELRGARFSLSDAASALGVTPIYLTQAFKAAEGIPLYRYCLNVRLNQALARLPRVDSITDLALDLGFSSHSHFSAAFTSRYGETPSEYRAKARDNIVAIWRFTSSDASGAQRARIRAKSPPRKLIS